MDFDSCHFAGAWDFEAAFRFLENNCAPLTFIVPCVVIYFYSKSKEMHRFLKFILFCSSTLHVSDGLSVHRQESKTVHTASGICQTYSTDCLLAGTRWNGHTPVSQMYFIL